MLLVGGSDFVSGSALYPNSLFFLQGHWNHLSGYTVIFKSAKLIPLSWVLPELFQYMNPTYPK